MPSPPSPWHAALSSAKSANSLSSLEIAIASSCVMLASPTVGWTEGASVVAPAPVLESLSAAGTVVEITGQLVLSVRGGDYGSTRSTVTGVANVRPLGSAIEAVSALAVPTERASR